MKRIKKPAIRIFLVATVWVLAHMIFITVDGFTDKQKTADIALILGNKVNIDGTLSERLEKRMECGLEMYRKSRVKRILVSGGLGKEGHFEGDKMKAYLLKKGVPDSLIVVDNLGNNTIASVENTLKLQNSLGFKSVLVVSQYFHVTRTKMLFRKRNFNNVSSVSPVYFDWRDPYSIAREFAGYYTQ